MIVTLIHVLVVTVWLFSDWNDLSGRSLTVLSAMLLSLIGWLGFFERKLRGSAAGSKRVT